MSVERENDYGRWVPAEPLPEPFGIRWERHIRHRRNLGHGRLRAFFCGWLDARSVDRLADEQEPE